MGIRCFTLTLILYVWIAIGDFYTAFPLFGRYNYYKMGPPPGISINVSMNSPLSLFRYWGHGRYFSICIPLSLVFYYGFGLLVAVAMFSIKATGEINPPASIIFRVTYFTSPYLSTWAIMRITFNIRLFYVTYAESCEFVLSKLISLAFRL